MQKAIGVTITPRSVDKEDGYLLLGKVRDARESGAETPVGHLRPEVVNLASVGLVRSEGS
jgi:hypothetical protein